MDNATIITLTILLILTVAILVLAGLALSARAFTQLAELIASNGSLLARLLTEHRQVQTTLSQLTEHNMSSAQPPTTPTTQENQD